MMTVSPVEYGGHMSDPSVVLRNSLHENFPDIYTVDTELSRDEGNALVRIFGTSNRMSHNANFTITDYSKLENSIVNKNEIDTSIFEINQENKRVKESFHRVEILENSKYSENGKDYRYIKICGITDYGSTYCRTDSYKT